MQPPAYREPKPTIKPPSARIRKPFNENKASILNNSFGWADVGAAIPNLAKSLIVFSEIATGAPSERNCFVIKPPKIAPTKNTKFHNCDRQLKSKNFTNFPPPATEQIVLKLDENPNDYPKNNNKNIVLTIIIPNTHQVQG